MTRPEAPAPAPTQGEDLDGYGKKVETPASAADTQKNAPWNLKRIALDIAKDCDGPVLVRFINTAPIDLKTQEGKAARQASMNSSSLLAVWESGNRTGDPVACALTRYAFQGRFSVEVSGVAREACAVINSINAPALVILSARNPETGERQHVKVLEGKIQPAMVIAAMREVLQGRGCDKLSQFVQQFDRNLAAVEALQGQIAMKQDMAAQAAKNPAKAAQIQTQIETLNKELDAAQAKLEACKAKFTEIS